MDQQTAYDLIASHGNVDDLVFFAELVQGAVETAGFNARFHPIITRRVHENTSIVTRNTPCLHAHRRADAQTSRGSSSTSSSRATTPAPWRSLPSSPTWRSFTGTASRSLSHILHMYIPYPCHVSSHTLFNVIHAVRFAPVLMQHADRAIVDACLRRRDIEPRLLIPAFIRYQQTGTITEAVS